MTTKPQAIGMDDNERAWRQRDALWRANGMRCDRCGRGIADHWEAQSSAGRILLNRGAQMFKELNPDGEHEGIARDLDFEFWDYLRDHPAVHEASGQTAVIHWGRWADIRSGYRLCLTCGDELTRLIGRFFFSGWQGS